MLKQAKLGVLRTAEAAGISRLIAGSRWRRRRLLILCYHGVSLEDEHEWNPHLYMPGELFRRRMQLIAESGCTVLGLDEAVRRLHEGTLPSRSVVITADDGSYDFYRVAFPIIREFRFPVTLYYTTYYSEYNRPVFDTMCSYLLWKGRNRKVLDWPGVLGAPADPGDPGGRLRATREIIAFALRSKLSGRDKDGLLQQLSGRLGIDYDELCRKRLLHLITPAEAREMAAQGLDVQYHTHRHRVYRSQERFHRELDDNKQRIAAVTAVEPRHFCYTGGFYLPQFPSILEAYGIRSATTCDPGFCTPESHPMLLPRFLDATPVSDVEFRAWLSGTAAFLPRRRYAAAGGQLVEEQDEQPAPAPSAA
jgi:peptidoglycan/xylan/chitin deacetylase (PgdA/CDA1 family)